VIKPDNPCYIKLANSWIILNSGGGPHPTSPKSSWKLRPILRVADIWACYKDWRAKGAVFLTEPLDNHS
jgi:hypothetical protein